MEGKYARSRASERIKEKKRELMVSAIREEELKRVQEISARLEWRANRKESRAREVDSQVDVKQIKEIIYKNPNALQHSEEVLKKSLRDLVDGCCTHSSPTISPTYGSIKVASTPLPTRLIAEGLSSDNLPSSPKSSFFQSNNETDKPSKDGRQVFKWGKYFADTANSLPLPMAPTTGHKGKRSDNSEENLANGVFLAGPSASDVQQVIATAYDSMISNSFSSSSMAPFSVKVEPAMLYKSELDDKNVEVDSLPSFCFPSNCEITVKPDMSPLLTTRGRAASSVMSNCPTTAVSVPLQSNDVAVSGRYSVPATPLRRDSLKTEKDKGRQVVFLLTGHSSTQFGMGFLITKRFKDLDKGITVSFDYCICILTSFPYVNYYFYIIQQFVEMEGLNFSIPIDIQDESFPLQTELRHLNDLTLSLVRYQVPKNNAEKLTFSLNVLQYRAELGMKRLSDVFLDRETEVNHHILMWALPILLRYIPLDQILLVLGCLIVDEMKMIVRCPDMNITSGCLLALVQLLRPLRWSNIFIATLPWKMEEYLECPVPLIVGVDKLPGWFEWSSGTIIIDPTDHLVQLHPRDVVSSHLLSLPQWAVLKQRLKKDVETIKSITVKSRRNKQVFASSPDASVSSNVGGATTNVLPPPIELEDSTRSAQLKEAVDSFSNVVTNHIQMLLNSAIQIGAHAKMQKKKSAAMMNPRSAINSTIRTDSSSISSDDFKLSAQDAANFRAMSRANGGVGVSRTSSGGAAGDTSFSFIQRMTGTQMFANYYQNCLSTKNVESQLTEEVSIASALQLSEGRTRAQTVLSEDEDRGYLLSKRNSSPSPSSLHSTAMGHPSSPQSHSSNKDPLVALFGIIMTGSNEPLNAEDVTLMHEAYINNEYPSHGVFAKRKRSVETSLDMVLPAKKVSVYNAGGDKAVDTDAMNMEDDMLEDDPPNEAKNDSDNESDTGLLWCNGLCGGLANTSRCTMICCSMWERKVRRVRKQLKAREILEKHYHTNVLPAKVVVLDGSVVNIYTDVAPDLLPEMSVMRKRHERETESQFKLRQYQRGDKESMQENVMSVLQGSKQMVFSTAATGYDPGQTRREDKNRPTAKKTIGEMKALDAFSMYFKCKSRNLALNKMRKQYCSQSPMSPAYFDGKSRADSYSSGASGLSPKLNYSNRDGGNGCDSTDGGELNGGDAVSKRPFNASPTPMLSPSQTHKHLPDTHDAGTGGSTTASPSSPCYPADPYSPATGSNINMHRGQSSRDLHQHHPHHQQQRRNSRHSMSPLAPSNPGYTVTHVRRQHSKESNGSGGEQSSDKRSTVTFQNGGTEPEESASARASAQQRNLSPSRSNSFKSPVVARAETTANQGNAVLKQTGSGNSLTPNTHISAVDEAVHQQEVETNSSKSNANVKKSDVSPIPAKQTNTPTRDRSPVRSHNNANGHRDRDGSSVNTATRTPQEQSPIPSSKDDNTADHVHNAVHTPNDNTPLQGGPASTAAGGASAAASPMDFFLSGDPEYTTRQTIDGGSALHTKPDRGSLKKNATLATIPHPNGGNTRNPVNRPHTEENQHLHNPSLSVDTLVSNATSLPEDADEQLPLNRLSIDNGNPVDEILDAPLSVLGEEANMLTSQQQDSIKEMWNLLREGVIVMKHGKTGKPHQRLLFCDFDMSRLCWRDSAAWKDSVASITAGIPVNLVTALEEKERVSISKSRRSSLYGGRASLMGGVGVGRFDSERELMFEDILEVKVDGSGDVMQRSRIKEYLHMPPPSQQNQNFSLWHHANNTNSDVNTNTLLSIVTRERSLDMEVPADKHTALHQALQILITYYQELRPGLRRDREESDLRKKSYDGYEDDESHLLP